MTRTARVSSLAFGLLLVVGAPAAWWLAQPPATVGDVELLSAAPASIPPTVPLPPGTSATGPGASGAGASTPPGPSAADPAPTTAEDAFARPVGVAIPAIAVDAPVVEVGLEQDRSMEIPDDVTTVGWYEPGVLPGAPGSAVLAGHVDSRSQGRGAFFDLRRLDVDDLVTVAHEDGSSSEWRVVARTTYPKDELPIADIFTRFGGTRLVLITCGGAFDSDTRHYRENVVVYTEPAPTPSA